MSRCFVMQPFDRGPFDKRYDDVLAPAIEAAGMEAYRVDRDSAASIPIESIEAGIRNSELCLADITIDNPNVWFELGFTIASGKDVVLICSASRTTKFPFDVQHRHIITYSSESPRDFENLKTAIRERIAALLTKERRLDELVAAGPVAATQGLTPQEIVALVVVMESALDPESPPSAYSIKNDMDKAGYTGIAAVLSIKSLERKGLVEAVQASSYNREDYTGYVVTATGEDWLLTNQGKLVLRKGTRHDESFEDFPEDLPL